jgi:hypothetical protein
VRVLAWFAIYAAGIGQGHAEGAHGAIRAFGFPREGVALASGLVFARAVGDVQPVSGGWKGALRTPGPGGGLAPRRERERSAVTG